MNDILKAIFNSYENEKQKIRKRIDANEETIQKLNKELDILFNDCVSIKDRANAYKENKSTILEIEKKLAAAKENEIILKTAIKLANEMKLDIVANALRTEIVNNPEKWTKYPIHFKKFQEIIKEFLNGTNLYFYNTYNSGSYYLSGQYCDYGDIRKFILDTKNGSITPEIIEELKTKQEYPIIKSSEIITEVKKAFKTRQKIIAKYESTKKEIDAMRAQFNSNTIYYILPYAPITMENYKYF